MNEVYVVTGYPRTGTSHFMYCLLQGGIDVIWSEERQQYQLNDHGCFEVSAEEEKQEQFLKTREYIGKAVKCFVPRLIRIAQRSKLKYKVIFPLRSFDETSRSHKEKFGAVTKPLRNEAEWNHFLMDGIFRLSACENVDLSIVPLAQYNLNPVLFWHELSKLKHWPLDYLRVANAAIEEVYGGQ